MLLTLVHLLFSSFPEALPESYFRPTWSPSWPGLWGAAWARSTPPPSENSDREKKWKKHLSLDYGAYTHLEAGWRREGRRRRESGRRREGGRGVGDEGGRRLRSAEHDLALGGEEALHQAALLPARRIEGAQSAERRRRRRHGRAGLQRRRRRTFDFCCCWWSRRGVRSVADLGLLLGLLCHRVLGQVGESSHLRQT